MDFAIHKATREDLPSVLALYAQLGMDDGEVLPLDKAERIYDRMQAYPDYKLYVALKQGLPVGVFALLIMDNLGHQGASSGVVEDVVVHKDLRGQGIGKRMMDYAVRKCRERGCYKVSLSSNLRREEAHQFYEALGYKQHGHSYFTELQDEDMGNE